MVATLTVGAIFVMWLGEQITERGIGNGMSLLITVSILERIWPAVSRDQYVKDGIVQPIPASSSSRWCWWRWSPRWSR